MTFSFFARDPVVCMAQRYQSLWGFSYQDTLHLRNIIFKGTYKIYSQYSIKIGLLFFHYVENKNYQK